MLPRRSALRAVRTLATEAGASNNTLRAPTPHLSTLARSKPLLEASVIVNRSPTITRSPSRFEKTFFHYQSRIARALHNPFPYEFYFKQGSPLEAQFNIEERKRERQAFGRLTRPVWEATEANLEAAELAREEVGKRATRFTDADKRKDLRSLDRRGERNLYLVTKSGNGPWSFPRAPIRKGEFLHQVRNHCHCFPLIKHHPAGCRTRPLSTLRDKHRYLDGWAKTNWAVQAHGTNRRARGQPVVLFVWVSSLTTSQTLVFFYKTHILAGQIEPNGSSAVDFAWLTKEEIKGYVERGYWHGVKDMLSDL